MKKKGVVLVVVVGFVAIGISLSLLMLLIVYNRYKKAKEYVDFVSDSSLVHAGLSRAYYKIQNNDFGEEDFIFSDNVIPIDVEQDSSDPSISSVEVTSPSGTTVLNAELKGLLLTSYEVRRK